MNKFSVGQKIQHRHPEHFSYTNIMSGRFEVMGINEKTQEYVLKQPNFWGNRSISYIDAVCVLIQ
jgi:hypothetical protein